MRRSCSPRLPSALRWWRSVIAVVTDVATIAVKETAPLMTAATTAGSLMRSALRHERPVTGHPGHQPLGLQQADRLADRRHRQVVFLSKLDHGRQLLARCQLPG